MMRTIYPSNPERIGLCESKSWALRPAEAEVPECMWRGDQSTALSLAVRSRAPLQVVRDVVQADPGQLEVSCWPGGTILHEAVKHGVDGTVLEYLVHEVRHRPHARRSFIEKSTDELGRTVLSYVVDRIKRYLEQWGRITSTDRRVFQWLVDVHPKSVAISDADGDTPLLLLLMTSPFGDGPTAASCEGEVAQLVRYAVEKYPPAVNVARRMPKPWHYHMKRTGDGDRSGNGVPTPVSCAVLYGRSEGTIDLLLHESKRLGLNACAAMVSHRQEYPLHIAVTMRSCNSLVTKLVHEASHVVNVSDITGLRPLDWMWIRHCIDRFSSPYATVDVSRRRFINPYFLQSHEYLTNLYIHEIESTHHNNNVLGDGDWNDKLRWALVEGMGPLLQEMARQKLQGVVDPTCDRMDTEGDHDNYLSSLLHCASVVDCPLAVVALACSANPKMVCTKDERMDRLPLHYAACRNGYNREFPIGVTGALQSIQEVSPVHFLLPRYPLACTITDIHNQLPLHIAIDHAKSERTKGRETSHFYDTSDGSARQLSQNMYKEIDAILNCYPDALHRRDGKTKLFPFQQAAVGPTADVELTFLLLRRDPTLMDSKFY